MFGTPGIPRNLMLWSQFRGAVHMLHVARSKFDTWAQSHVHSFDFGMTKRKVCVNYLVKTSNRSAWNHIATNTGNRFILFGKTHESYLQDSLLIFLDFT